MRDYCTVVVALRVFHLDAANICTTTCHTCTPCGQRQVYVSIERPAVISNNWQ